MERLSRVTRREKSSKETLDDIFDDLLKDIYWTEKHLAVKVLPKLAKASFSEDLRNVFERHLEETKVQINRIEECFDFVDGKASSRKCEVMKGLAKGCFEVIEKHGVGPVRDILLIAAVQKIEHYEISAYGTLQTMATVLRKTECARLLEETKDEEAAADIKLTDLSARINHLAVELIEEKFW
jgi:ferritin-like metal-binding protein YciE